MQQDSRYVGLDVHADTIAVTAPLMGVGHVPVQEAAGHENRSGEFER
jgi:hypothetical protein